MFSTSSAGVIGYPHAKKEKKKETKRKKRTQLSSQHIVHTLEKINLKWTVYLNVRAKTIKLVEENIGENIYKLELHKNILGGTQHKS